MRVSDLGFALARSHKSLWGNLRTNLRALERDPEFASTLTIPNSRDDTTKILHNLPQPEFDDTGFVGREKELSDLKKALTGSYPVVTVVGEGGLGKTALALKACYDLLDDGQSGLDAIVWTTAKTTKLTVNEIRVIEGAIASSIGIIESAAEPLGRQTGTEALDDLITHLTNNKILLVIDNLETVIDHNIRYLVSNIPKNSRILFTTRVALGAFDFPISLLPFNKKEAAFYFRRAAQVLGVNDFATTPANTIGEYCEKLHNNTLFIKWFIQSVRVGKRPTVLISNPTVFLQFCLQNVFSSLSSDSKTVARTLSSVSGHQSVASLAFFTELDSISIQGALSVLITSNLVTTERGRSTEEEDRYNLSPLARMYMQKFIRPDADEQKRLIRRQNELRSAREEFAARSGIDIFDLNNVFIRDKDDYIVAKFLTRAIECLFKGDFSGAESEIEKADDLSPNYFEVHRVKAMFNVAQGDVFAAAAAYEGAISLAPERAPLRMWYGGFLSRSLGDQDGALAQLLEAEKLAPSAVSVKLECARVLQYLRRFDEAAERLSAIPNIEKQPSRIRRIHLDLSLQNEVRRAESLANAGNCEGALRCLENARTIFDGASGALIDHRTIRNLNHARRCFPALRREFHGLSESKRLAEVEKWLPFPSALIIPNAGGAVAPSAEADGSDAPEEVGGIEPLPNRGRLTQIHHNYAFVDVVGTNYFFHRGTWIGKSDFVVLGEGTIVQFDIGQRSDKGPVAQNVKPVAEIETEGQGEPPSEKRYLGAIRSLSATFGLIKLDSGGEAVFRREDCAQTTRFTKLAVGDRVRCKCTVDDQGGQSGYNVELYSGLIAG